jgi:hypothetical protein
VPVLPISGGVDREFFAELAALGAIEEVLLHVAKSNVDFANPGRRTTPAFHRNYVETGTDATLTNAVTFTAIDRDSDGFFEFLQAIANVEVVTPGTYTAMATLEDPEGNLQFENLILDLGIGLQRIEFSFNGETIRQRRVNGVFQVRDIILTSALSQQRLDQTHFTQHLTSADFGIPMRAALSSVPLVHFENSNSLESSNDLEVEFTVNTLGMSQRKATLIAFLYTTDGRYIGGSSTSQMLGDGENVYKLKFKSEQLRFARLNGGVELRNVSLIDDGGSRLDFLPEVDLRVDFLADSFGAIHAMIRSLESDGKVKAENGELLRTSISINVITGSTYTVRAILYSESGHFIAAGETTTNFATGLHDVELEFPMQSVLTNKIDGPFVVRAIQILQQDGQIVDSSPTVEFTSPYIWGEFSGDVVLPESSVVSPTSIVRSTRFGVTWGGNDGDDGTGIRSYDLYVSDNGGPYTRWIENSEATTATFSGAYGRQYSFYSVAMDNARNREVAPINADLIVRIVSPGHNVELNEDVNDDGNVTALDALLVINFINRNQQTSTLLSISVTGFSFDGNWVDVSGDGLITALDALRVINYLNRNQLQSLSGEPQGADRILQPLVSSSSDTIFSQLARTSDDEELDSQGSSVLF